MPRRSSLGWHQRFPHRTGVFGTDRVPDERAVPHHTAVDRQREDSARRQPIIPWFLLEL